MNGCERWRPSEVSSTTMLSASWRCGVFSAGKRNAHSVLTSAGLSECTEQPEQSEYPWERREMAKAEVIVHDREQVAITAAQPTPLVPERT
jgi:hypothetical protein